MFVCVFMCVSVHAHECFRGMCLRCVVCVVSVYVWCVCGVCVLCGCVSVCDECGCGHASYSPRYSF